MELDPDEIDEWADRGAAVIRVFPPLQQALPLETTDLKFVQRNFRGPRLTWPIVARLPRNQGESHFALFRQRRAVSLPSLRQPTLEHLVPPAVWKRMCDDTGSMSSSSMD